MLLATAASVAVAVGALDRASGVTRPHGRCCRTEFIDTEVLGLPWLLYPLLAVAAAWSWRLALLDVPAVAVPQWPAMNEVMDRYTKNGWGDGLEVLGYVLAIQTAAIGAIVILVGALVGRLLPGRAACAEERQSG